jgi:hypothetical protein
LLGSLDLEGENFYYQNPLTAHNARYPWHGCPCCIGNIPRVLLMLPTWTYVKDDSNLYVNMFLGSRITVPGIAGTNVEMVQKTDYPWDGKVSITVNPEKSGAFGIRIRVPNHEVSELYTATPKANGILWIKVNGKPVEPKIEKGYAVIERTWKAGDKIDFELPMVVQKIHGDEKIAATRGQVALRYGPLLYMVESVDQPMGKTVAADAEFTAYWKPDFLEGIVAIGGKWSDGTPLVAIPYYARFNRSGESGDAGKFGGPGAIGSTAEAPRGEGRPVSWVWIEEE